MLMVALKVLAIFIGVYILTVLALLAVTRLKKDEHGDPILDSNSWHFRMAYPFQKFGDHFLVYVKENGISICPYFSKLVFMLYLGWPWIIFGKIMVFLMSVIFCVPFGFWVSFNLKQWAWVRNFLEYNFSLPKIGGFKIRPIYIILPAVYAWLWLKYPVVTGQMTVYLISIVAVITIFLGIYYLLGWLKDFRTVSLSAAWVANKKKGLCRNLKVI